MKAKFIEIFKKNIKRDGAEKLLEWLEKSDFFHAPASTQYHGSTEGGLCEHSVNVYEQLKWLVSIENNTTVAPSEESMAIIGLLHDVCKVNFYEVFTRNVKNEETQKWEKVDSYRVNEKFPFGHGEKSVFLIERYMKLTVEEAVCIRFHMGAYEGEHAWRDLSNAYEKFPLALITHFADMRANHFLEKK